MQRYFIRNCLNQIVGNPKGYATSRGANAQANMKTSRVFADIWNTFNVESDKLDAEGVAASGREIYSVLLEDVADTKAAKVESEFVEVYRVECGGGYGMYKRLWTSLALPNDDNHPNVWSDSLYTESLNIYKEFHKDIKCTGWLGEPYGHRFGFKDVTQLRRWIYNDSWIINLSQAGAVLVKYKVPVKSLIVGRTQVTFMHKEAVKVSSEPLAKVFLEI